MALDMLRLCEDLLAKEQSLGKKVSAGGGELTKKLNVEVIAPARLV